MTPEQKAYVKQQLESGVEHETLKSVLRESGYSEELISSLISSAQVPPATTPIPPPQTPPLKPEEKSSFQKNVLIIILVLVIAIVGLIMIVASSLNDARDGGLNASAKQLLGNARSQAEIYYNDNADSYAGFCESPKFLRLSTLDDFQFDCEDGVYAYRASVRLISDTSGPQYWCVDSTGRTEMMSTRPEGLGCGSGLTDQVNEINAQINESLSERGLLEDGSGSYVTEDNVLQAEQLIFADSAKLARRYYNQNDQSYLGFCQYLLEEMNNSGLQFSCMSEDIQYRVSIHSLDGTYLCLFDVANSNEQTVTQSTEPTGLYCGDT